MKKLATPTVRGAPFRANMRAVIQRVARASVDTGGERVGAIGRGVLIFLGVGKDDTEADGEWLVRRILKLRIFDDADGRMNLSLEAVGGEALVVSQFTLFGTLKKGNRPSFNRAAPPETAVPLYENFAARLGEALGRPVPTGRFGEPMAVEAHNDGPVTLVVDTRERDF